MPTYEYQADVFDQSVPELKSQLRGEVQTPQRSAAVAARLMVAQIGQSGFAEGLIIDFDLELIDEEPDDADV
jgi:hypothetical protein